VPPLSCAGLNQSPASTIPTGGNEANGVNLQSHGPAAVGQSETVPGLLKGNCQK
jgi:hypothetical protein